MGGKKTKAIDTQPCPSSTNATTEVGCIVSHYSYRVSDDVRPLDTTIESSFEEAVSRDVSDSNPQTALCRLKSTSVTFTVYATVPEGKSVSRVVTSLFSPTTQLVTSVAISKINADGLNPCP